MHLRHLRLGPNNFPCDIFVDVAFFLRLPPSPILAGLPLPEKRREEENQQQKEKEKKKKKGKEKKRKKKFSKEAKAERTEIDLAHDLGGLEEATSDTPAAVWSLQSGPRDLQAPQQGFRQDGAGSGGGDDRGGGVLGPGLSALVCVIVGFV